MIKKMPCVGICLLLSGCSTVIDWGQKSFKQSTPIETNRDKITAHIRSETIYDQFDTQARFVALWLNDEVRTEYAKLHGRSRGSSPEQEEIIIKRQLEEGKHFITFYVLSLAEVPLGELDSEWHLFLKINDTTIIVPTDVKQIDLPYEYKYFFGKHFTRFKVAYRVLFDAQDLEDRCIIDATTQTVTLVIRSVDKEVQLSWQTPSQLLHCASPGAQVLSVETVSPVTESATPILNAPALTTTDAPAASRSEKK